MTTERHTPAADAASRMSTRVEDLDFIATRTFDVPRTLVFKAFSDCEALSHWWGPNGWSLPVCEMDFREGGTWFYCMRSATGEDACGKTVYHEIIEPERIVLTDAFAERDGSLQFNMPQMTATITFIEEGGKTTLTNRTRFATAKDLETVLGTGMVDGLTETWDRLEAYLAAS